MGREQQDPRGSVLEQRASAARRPSVPAWIRPPRSPTPWLQARQLPAPRTRKSSAKRLPRRRPAMTATSTRDRQPAAHRRRRPIQSGRAQLPTPQHLRHVVRESVFPPAVRSGERSWLYAPQQKSARVRSRSDNGRARTRSTAGSFRAPVLRTPAAPTACSRHAEVRSGLQITPSLIVDLLLGDHARCSTCHDCEPRSRRATLHE